MQTQNLELTLSWNKAGPKVVTRESVKPQCPGSLVRQTGGQYVAGKSMKVICVLVAFQPQAFKYLIFYLNKGCSEVQRGAAMCF